jgi:TonB family protein
MAVAVLPFTAAVQCCAQSATNSNVQPSEAVLTNLLPPVYPLIAKTAHITGDVDLTLDVRPDGSIESAAVASGPPLLREAALKSVRQSQFECRQCSEAVTTQRVVYTFQLGPTSHCGRTEIRSNVDQLAESYPRVMQSKNHVTLIDQPIGTCDMAGEIGVKVRSLKCLYLWKCGLS